jgi:hypothetical protein
MPWRDHAPPHARSTLAVASRQSSQSAPRSLMKCAFDFDFQMFRNESANVSAAKAFLHSRCPLKPV